jgi:hypothetical protein
MERSSRGNAGAEAYYETLVAALSDILESGDAATNEALIVARVQLHRSIRIAMGLPVEVASETPGGEAVPTVIDTDLYVEDHYDIIDACGSGMGVELLSGTHRGLGGDSQGNGRGSPS